MEQKKLTLQMIPTSPVEYNNPVCDLSPIQVIGHKRCQVDFDVYLPSKGFNLQREKCWNIEHKQNFILSILRELPIAPVYANYIMSERKFEIIDGKQRMSTLYDFYVGGFPLTVDGQDYYFDDFDQRLQMRIAMFDFNVCIHYEHEDGYGKLSDEDKIKWFLFLNNSCVPQENEHIETLKNHIKI